jgi:small conductance mechanosensitive channel
MNSLRLLAATTDAEPTGWSVDQTVSYLQQHGMEFLLNLVTAAVIFFVGRWVARLLTGIVRRVMDRAKVDEALARFLANILYVAMLVFVVMAALERLGVSTTSFAAIVAAAGLAVGLALQDSLKNFAAGVMIILFKPFTIGNFVEVAGKNGSVEEIHIFNTLLRTPDNKSILVPNGQIIDAVIVNFSAKPTRRIDLVFGCGYGDDLRAVKQYLKDVLDDDPRVLQDPEPNVAVDDLSDNSVNFVVRPWVNAEDYWAVRWDLTERIKLGFDERGFSIPYPSRDVYTHAS